MSQSAHNTWLHRFAVLTAAATLGLLCIGGLVTSKEAGMAVPDWPTSYGYNMFALPIQFWKGGVFYEHTHRLWASCVGVLVVALTRWLGGRPARVPLAIIGLAEMLAGFAIFQFLPQLKGTGHFLTGIGGVVLLGALVWVRNEPAKGSLPQLGWWMFALVQLQGLLGGLRVVMIQSELGIFHATLAQVFFVLTCAVALLTSRWWITAFDAVSDPQAAQGTGLSSGAKRLLVATTLLILAQLALGATMRHQHAGLAISDFPLAHGKLWPATDPDSLVRYNQYTGEHTITAFQIYLQMAHRIVAVLILVAVVSCVTLVRRSASVRRLGWVWLGLILGQVVLGAFTIWSNKAADVATAHVLVGALSLATGALMCIVSLRKPQTERQPAARTEPESPAGGTLVARTI